jgi:hypothetical protein
MKRILLGGEPFEGFEGDLGKVYYDEQPEEPCILCLNLTWGNKCRGTFKCPYVEDLRRGIIHDCVEH